LLALPAGPAGAQSAAYPYASDYAKQLNAATSKIEVALTEQWVDYLDTVRFSYFGFGCKVVTEQGITGYLARIGSSLERKTIVGMRRGIAERLDAWTREFHSAVQGCMALAASRGCTFWRDNPEAVHKFRQAAQANPRS
jgi:hypothetical protein